MVPKSRDTEKEASENSFSDSRKDESFSTVLEYAVKKEAAASPLSCHTCTYGANRKLFNFLYESKEYTY